MRFVHVTHGNWDDHTDLDKNLKKNCDITDQPAAALLKDLKQRGLLDSTLVIWGGEFGRTPDVAAAAAGYRLRTRSSSQLLQHVAGWRRRSSGGQVVGKTDEFGLQYCRRPGACARSAGNHPALPGVRSHEADLSSYGTGFPADGCRRDSRAETSEVVRSKRHESRRCSFWLASDQRWPSRRVSKLPPTVVDAQSILPADIEPF